MTRLGRPAENQGRDSATSGAQGAAVVEFTLVAVLLVVLFLGILQLGLVLHVRNTLVASAAEGARYAANADRGPADGAKRAVDLIEQSFGPGFAQSVTAGREMVGGVPTVVVEVRATLPLVGLLGPHRMLIARGHALDEEEA